MTAAGCTRGMEQSRVSVGGSLHDDLLRGFQETVRVDPCRRRVLVWLLRRPCSSQHTLAHRPPSNWVRSHAYGTRPLGAATQAAVGPCSLI